GPYRSASGRFFLFVDADAPRPGDHPPPVLGRIACGPERAGQNRLHQISGVPPIVSHDPPSFRAPAAPPVLRQVLADRSLPTPPPIQAATLPDSLAGRDVLGRGRTGSGKTYAFVLPVLARLAASGTRRQPRRPRALILAPTRELATQI